MSAYKPSQTMLDEHRIEHTHCRASEVTAHLKRGAVHELVRVEQAAAAAARGRDRAGGFARVATVHAQLRALVAGGQPPLRRFDEAQVGVVGPAVGAWT